MEKIVYQGKIIKISEEIIGGINWERAYLPHGVIIFPINDQGEILMIEEKRPHENPPFRLKPISGILEQERGTPEDNAQIELQEEVGFKATTLFNFWTMRSSGTVNNTQYFFLARGLVASKLPNPDGEDTILSIKAFKLDVLHQLYLDDKIPWSHSTLGFFRLYHGLKSQKI